MCNCLYSKIQELEKQAEADRATPPPLRVRFSDGSVHIVKNYQAPDLVKIVGKADQMFKLGVECEWVN